MYGKDRLDLLDGVVLNDFNIIDYINSNVIAYDNEFNIILDKDYKLNNV